MFQINEREETKMIKFEVIFSEDTVDGCKLATVLANETILILEDYRLIDDDTMLNSLAVAIVDKMHDMIDYKDQYNDDKTLIVFVGLLNSVMIVAKSFEIRKFIVNKFYLKRQS